MTLTILSRGDIFHYLSTISDVRLKKLENSTEIICNTILRDVIGHELAIAVDKSRYVQVQ